MKRLLLMLAAFVCSVQLMQKYEIHSEEISEDSYQMVVVGMNINGDCTVTKLGDNYQENFYVKAEMLQKHYTGTEEIAYGDILLFPKAYFICEMLGKTNNCYFINDAARITKAGSIFGEVTTKTFEITSKNQCYIDLSDDNTTFGLTVDYVTLDGYQQPGGIDWTAVTEGDEVTMLTYDGIPLIPTAPDSHGDINDDSEVNALDASNLLVTAAEIGAGIRSTAAASEDINADGTVDAQDAAAVLTYAAAQGSGNPLSWAEILR